MDAPLVRLDLELCKACGICIELCPDQVFDRDAMGYPLLARPEACSQCLICELHCPDFAIEVRRRRRKGGSGKGGDEAAAGAEAQAAPALTREQLVAATRSAAEESVECDHDGEEG